MFTKANAKIQTTRLTALHSNIDQSKCAQATHSQINHAHTHTHTESTAIATRSPIETLHLIVYKEAYKKYVQEYIMTLSLIKTGSRDKMFLI